MNLVMESFVVEFKEHQLQGGYNVGVMVKGCNYSHIIDSYGRIIDDYIEYHPLYKDGAFKFKM